jgi:hypothetical protein
MKRFKTDFETRDDGYLWGRIEGRNWVRVSTAMTPVQVYRDYRGLQFAVGIQARPTDRAPFVFRLDARELFVRTTFAVEQAVAWIGIECFRVDLLSLFLQTHLPTTDAIEVKDLHFRDEDEPSNSWMKRVYEEGRKQALASCDDVPI